MKTSKEIVSQIRRKAEFYARKKAVVKKSIAREYGIRQQMLEGIANWAESK